MEKPMTKGTVLLKPWLTEAQPARDHEQSPTKQKVEAVITVQLFQCADDLGWFSAILSNLIQSHTICGWVLLNTRTRAPFAAFFWTSSYTIHRRVGNCPGLIDLKKFLVPCSRKTVSTSIFLIKKKNEFSKNPQFAGPSMKIYIYIYMVTL